MLRCTSARMHATGGCPALGVTMAKINPRVVMTVLMALAMAWRDAPDAKAERIATKWANRLGRLHVPF